jgi:hypothetical protein
MTAYNIFKAGELRRTNRTACMQSSGGNPDFGTHAKLATIGKLG